MTSRVVRVRRPTVVKLGGELVQNPTQLRRLARSLADLGAREPLVVVHGGGPEVDAEMMSLGLQKRAVDGLRITDDATLDVVVGVLAGRVNTRLVAALGAAGASAVGLTGADASLAPVRRERTYRAADGRTVDLGYVGRPHDTGRPTVLLDLLKAGHMPIVASISAGPRGQLFNVNADTLAGHLAGRLRARRFVIAGGTAGVLDPTGRTIPIVNNAAVTHLITKGAANAGMVAKLLACRAALRHGVGEVAIINGRNPRRGLFDRTVSATVITQ